MGAAELGDMSFSANSDYSSFKAVEQLNKFDYFHLPSICLPCCINQNKTKIQQQNYLSLRKEKKKTLFMISQVQLVTP